MSTKTYSTAFHFILGLFSFSICLIPKLAPVFIILFFVAVGYGIFTKKLKLRFNWFFVSIILLYFIYIIGILYSKDLDLGIKYAEYKLSFLLVPLMFSIQPTFKISIKLPALGLALGTIIAGIIGFVNAFSCYETYPYVVQCFTSSNISPIHHPSYFSIYLLIAIILIWQLFKNDQRRLVRIGVVFYTIYASFMYLLCLSMAGLLFILVLGIVFGFLWLRKRFNLLIAGIGIVLLPILLVIISSTIPGLAEDIDATKKSVNEYVFNRDTFLDKMSKQAEINGNETRLVMWTVTFELIKQYPFGAGTGSLDVITSKKLKEYNLDDFASKNYNPHNQFLQTTLEIGIIGLIVLLCIFYFGFRIAVKHRSKILFVLLFAFCFNSLFESMFQRQSGIYFFTFWVCLLVVYLNNAIYDKNKLSIDNSNEILMK